MQATSCKGRHISTSVTPWEPVFSIDFLVKFVPAVVRLYIPYLATPELEVFLLMALSI